MPNSERDREVKRKEGLSRKLAPDFIAGLLALFALYLVARLIFY